MEKGYIFTKTGDEFEVKIEDLPEKSRAEVEILCDYCQSKIIKRKYKDYTIANKSNGKDCCKDCRMIKAKEIIKQKYNVENVFELASIQKEIHSKRIGENNPNWNGGTSNLRNYIRDKLVSEWRIISIINCNHTCVVTGIKSKDIEVHHLYPLHMVIEDILKELNLPHYKTNGEYSSEDLNSIVAKAKEYHDFHLGVVLLTDIHRLYHRIYGFNNDENQFNEFLKRFDDHEFDKILKIA